MDLDQARNAKKRHLSGSPSGKLWEDSSVSGDLDDDEEAENDVSEEDLQLSYLKKNGN